MNRKYTAIIVMVALIEGLTHFGAWMGDSNGYVSITHFFMGTATPLEWSQSGHWHGFLRPITPLLSAPLAFILGARTSIAVTNIAFLIIGSVFTGLLTEQLLGKYGSAFLGFIGGLFFASAAPNLIWGTSILTDGPGYAMLAVCFYWLWKGTWVSSNVRVLYTGLLFAGALLTKETTSILLAYLAIMLAVAWRRHAYGLRRFAWSTVAVSTIALGIGMLWGVFVVHVTYFTFYSQGITYAGGAYEGAFQNPTLFYDSILRSFYLILPFAFLGFFTLNSKNLARFTEIALAGFALLLSWGTLPESRFTFILFPAVIPIAVLGLNAACSQCADWSHYRISKHVWITLFVTIIIAYVNYATRRFFLLP